MERIGAVHHPNLLKIHALETVENATFVVMEWTRGFTLVELLRARRELGAEETLRLLPQAAGGIDHALGAGLMRLDLALHQVFIHFEDPSIVKESLLQLPVQNWPAFSLKLNPLGITHELSLSATWAGRQTIVGGIAAAPNENEDIRPRYIQALAAIFYELLGGTISPFALSSQAPQRYTPLATLSEQGNDVLRRALDPTLSYASANEFAQELRGLGELEVKRHETRAASSSSSPGMAAGRLSDSSASSSQRPVPPRPAPPIPEPPRRKSPAVLIGGIAALAVLGAGTFFLLPPGKKALPISEISSTGEQSEEPVESEPSKPDPDPVESTPEPTPPAPPQPTEQELIKAAVDEARELEKKEDHAEAIRAWLDIAKKYPQVGIIGPELDRFIESLRDRPEEVNKVEFPPIRELVTEAARLNVISAMMYLGDALLRIEPGNSFNWYAAAAARGQSIAQRRVGLMLSRGVEGAKPDLEKAVYYFQMASDNNDIDAKYYLGECYLNGRGVPRNEKIAVELLQESEKGDNVYAMDLLGNCYLNGLGVSKNAVKARELFTKASNLGYPVAKGNLGVLYMRGEGMAKKNQQKAVQLFLEGAEAGDPSCMFNYAQCLEAGFGVAMNLLKAKTFYKKAADLGHRDAVTWCNKHDVPVTPAR